MVGRNRFAFSSSDHTTLYLHCVSQFIQNYIWMILQRFFSSLFYSFIVLKWAWFTERSLCLCLKREWNNILPLVHTYIYINPTKYVTQLQRHCIIQKCPEFRILHLKNTAWAKNPVLYNIEQSSSSSKLGINKNKNEKFHGGAHWKFVHLLVLNDYKIFKCQTVKNIRSLIKKVC